MFKGKIYCTLRQLSVPLFSPRHKRGGPPAAAQCNAASTPTSPRSPWPPKEIALVPRGGGKRRCRTESRGEGKKTVGLPGKKSLRSLAFSSPLCHDPPIFASDFTTQSVSRPYKLVNQNVLCAPSEYYWTLFALICLYFVIYTLVCTCRPRGDG